MSETVKLHKYLADCAVASRRKSEELIASGVVKVNGHPAYTGQRIDPKKDIVTVRGERTEPAAVTHSYFVLYKPRGYITAMSDAKGQKCVSELFPEGIKRLFPVGRLDKDSEGLLLLTDDGDFANSISRPATGIKKTYVVTVTPAATEDMLVQLARGVVIDGRRTAQANVFVSSQSQDRTVLRVTIHEGRNRQIRKMCEAVGLNVIRLKRINVGPVALSHMKPGEIRALSKEELAALRRLIAKSAPG